MIFASFGRMTIIFKMQLLMELKYSFNRNELFSMILINIRQISILSVLLVAAFAPFYHSIFQIISFTHPYSANISIMLAVCNTFLVGLTLAPLWPKLSFLKPFWSFSTMFLKIFPYMLLVPALRYSIGSALENGLLGYAISTLNILYILLYVLLHEYLNESLKFIQIDFCNRRLISFPQQMLMVGIIVSVQLFGIYFACLAYIFRALFVLTRLYNQFQYRVVQRLYIFYCLLQTYIAFVVVIRQIQIIDSLALTPVSNSLFVIMGGALVSWAFSRQLSIHIYQKLLQKTQWGGERGQTQSSSGKQYNKLQHFENEIKILVQAIIQKRKFEEDKENDYDYYWKVYNERVYVHKLRCQEKHCICKNKKYGPKQLDQEIYVFDILKRVREFADILGKEGRIKVIKINVLVQIAKKPLKGYYQLISLKQEKNKQSLMFQIEDLVIRARECFDQIYYKNKVQNQQLDLMKNIQCEEIMGTIEEQLRSTLLQAAAFLQIFTYSTVKISQVQLESKKLFEAKKSIEVKLEKIIWMMGQNTNITLALFVFYRMLEVYRSRQVQFKKLSGQQSLKKRLIQKAEGQVVGQQQGIIYIDLVEERGRIKKITAPISDFFGYSKQDMVGFNINLFMPSLFGKYHARFLSNFIDKGRIKLLKERNRVVFGKNKKKFIFPIDIKLKTQHLQHDQFGASALITKIDTNSEFIIASAHARVQEMSQGLYRRIFAKSLKEDVSKLSKLCLYKLILGLNQVTENWQEKHSSKIHEGLIVFSDKDDYLLQKFRYNRQSTYSSINNRSKSLNTSTVSLTSNSLPTHSKSERFEYFSELFKSFLLDINPSRLRAIKINYKYSRMQTSQFQVELVEILNLKDQLSGKLFHRELVNELNNVGEVYQLLDQHSPLARHLENLDDEAEKRHSGKRLSKQMTLGVETINEHKNSNNTNKEIPFYSIVSEESFEDGSDEKLQFNPQMSEQSSLVGNTESQSKKQLLINAFNSNDSALPTTALFFAYLSLVVFLALLILLSYFSYTKAYHDHQLWNDTTYILSMRKIIEFRVAMVELAAFSSQFNNTLPQSLLNKTFDLNSEMVQSVKKINNLTFDHPPGGTYSFIIDLYDPNRNITYQATIPQVFTQLAWLIQQESQANKRFIRSNYQKIHTKLQQYYNIKYSYLHEANNKEFAIIKYFFGFYEGLLLITALCSLPLYIYFKREQLNVRSKLGFMSAKQIRKAITRLKFTHDFLRDYHKKGAITRLQMELSERRGQRQDEAINVNKTTKIMSQSQESKVFKNPILYILLLAFIVFFSNLSSTLFIITEISDTKFMEAVEANKLFYQMQAKIPLLTNTYLANLNSVLQSHTLVSIPNQLIDQASKGYFEIISELTHPHYTNTPITQQILGYATKTLCSQVACNANQNMSLSFLASSFKNRFDYWMPANGITPSSTSIADWVNENKISDLLSQVQYVLLLSSIVKSYVQKQFIQSLNRYMIIILILAGILIPANTIIMLFISYRFFNLLNGIIKSAEEIFMHFPVSVLVENTYLTSYFNSKAKNGK